MGLFVPTSADLFCCILGGSAIAFIPCQVMVDLFWDGLKTRDLWYLEPDLCLALFCALSYDRSLGPFLKRPNQPSLKLEG